MDDSVITKFDDHYNIVLNAGNKHKDMDHINRVLEEEFKGRDIKIETLFDNKSLIALQGPKAQEVLQQYISSDLSKLPFMSHIYDKVNEINGAEIQICRCGYTGEDGFEISIDNDHVEKFADLIFSDKSIAPCGLGARDSLRLESGLCLHGNDIDEATSPFEGVLMWTVRKNTLNNPYIGHDALMARKAAKRTVKRIGFVMEKSGIPRHGSKVLNQKGEEIGNVTSGTFSPNLKIGLGMAYVKASESKVGNKILIDVRGKSFEANVTKMPFIQQNYFRME